MEFKVPENDGSEKKERKPSHLNPSTCQAHKKRFMRMSRGHRKGEVITGRRKQTEN
jgi:hypothetical protein